MKPFSKTYFKSLLFVILVMSLFTNCSSAQKLQKNSPIIFGEVYYQSWVAGVEGGGSGINLFIPITKEVPQSIQLDSVYFRGKISKLEATNGELTLFVGRFLSEFNHKQDIIMNSDSNEEYGNQAPILQNKTPFDLKDSECVVSYIHGTKTKYFKIENIIQKQSEYYPTAPQN
jgi:hypothetical protein